MEDTLFGEGWLDRLLDEPEAPIRLRRRFRDALRKGEYRTRCRDLWKETPRLLKEGRIGEALEAALHFLRESLEALLLSGTVTREEISHPLVPALAGKGEIAALLRDPEEIDILTRPADDLENLQALATLNLVRRLTVSWGLCTWKGLPGILHRLDEDVKEIRTLREELEGLGREVDLEKEAELAEHYALAASRLARDLFELHLLNSRHPEVRMRFGILWGQVEQLLLGEDYPAAAQEAFNVLEEAFEAAGLGGGDLLEMVDILYPCFSRPEELRRAVDAMAAAVRGAEWIAYGGREREVVEAMRSALVDMGLLGN